MFRHRHVIVAQEDDVGPYLRLANEFYPFMNQGLTGLILGMGFAGKNELHRPLRIGQKGAAGALDRAEAVGLL